MLRMAGTIRGWGWGGDGHRTQRPCQRSVSSPLPAHTAQHLQVTREMPGHDMTSRPRTLKVVSAAWCRSSFWFGVREFLRPEHRLRPRKWKAEEFGVLAKQYLERGLLVPDNVITGVVMMELEKKQSQHWILDGFPRTLVQAEALDRICELDLVISLNIPFETLKDRLSARWIHPSSGRVYNMEFNPPHVHEQRCPTLIFWDRDQQNLALCLLFGFQQDPACPFQRSKLTVSCNRPRI
ncbi:adenylate kinase 4, mitochondrial isoform X1 [Pelodiscus sinensis]|uniref:adenylate kinase 4, mitochondrial isoform X1 n=1 Tax=Pelodiscus sinensis TaxID=13735 RepID=UPI003F6A6A07